MTARSGARSNAPVGARPRLADPGVGAFLSRFGDCAWTGVVRRAFAVQAYGAGAATRPSTNAAACGRRQRPAGRASRSRRLRRDGPPRAVGPAPRVREPASSSAVTSSASTTAGSTTSARATATRCCWPPDSCSTRWSATGSKPTASSAAAARSRTSSRLRPAPLQGDLHVLGRGQHRDQGIALRTGPNPSGTWCGSACPSSRTVAVSARSSPASRASRLDFAAARGTGDRQRVPGVRGDLHRVQDHPPDGPLATRR
jgi:hypothetical protein